MKSLLALMGILLLGTTLIAEAQAQSRRDDVLRRRNGNGVSRDRNRGGGRVDRGRGNGTGGGRVIRDRDNGRRNPDFGRDRDNGRVVRRDPVRRDPVRRDRWDNNRPNPRRDHIDRGSRRPNHPTYRHRPGWNNPNRRYTRYYHNPRRDRIRHNRRYNRRYDYHRTIPYRHVYNNRWVRYRVSYGNGYISIDGYPYFVYNGYRHRYSHYDLCDYELVDGYDNRVERTFFGYTCAQAYDYCAELRDDLNYSRSGYRYFCSEKIEFVSGYDYYDHWDYEDDFYYDVW